MKSIINEDYDEWISEELVELIVPTLSDVDAPKQVVSAKSRGPRPFCKCGCGQKVNWHSRKKDWCEYVAGHNTERVYGKVSKVADPSKALLCKCGCGKKVNYNYVAGRWCEYVSNHHLTALIPRQVVKVVGTKPRSTDKTRRLCKCGCGRKVNYSSSRQDCCDYVMGHNPNRIYSKVSEVSDPSKAPLCKCGCGMFVKYNYNTGDWCEYVSNHKPTALGKPPERTVILPKEFLHEFSLDILANVAPLCKCGCGQSVTWNVEKHRWNIFVKFHGIYKQYVAYKNPPLCKCGCGEHVKYNVNAKTWNKYLQGHQKNDHPLCKCGCGERVNYNYNIGKWGEYAAGHNPNIKHVYVPDPSEAPLCKCGCGEKVNYDRSAGKWRTYVKSHMLNMPQFYLAVLKVNKNIKMFKLIIAGFRKACNLQGIPIAEQDRMLREIGIVVSKDIINFEDIKMKSIGKSILKDLFPNGF
jgi:hypothetical protein